MCIQAPLWSSQMWFVDKSVSWAKSMLGSRGGCFWNIQKSSVSSIQMSEQNYPENNRFRDYSVPQIRISSTLLPKQLYTCTFFSWGSFSPTDAANDTLVKHTNSELTGMRMFGQERTGYLTSYNNRETCGMHTHTHLCLHMHAHE